MSWGELGEEKTFGTTILNPWLAVWGSGVMRSLSVQMKADGGS